MSLRWKTILGIALIEIVLLSILIGSSWGLLKRSGHDELVKRSRTAAQLFETALKDAVMVTDLATIEDFVEAIMDNPDMVYARVRGRDMVFAEKGDAAALARPFVQDQGFDTVTDGVFDIGIEVVEAGHYFGRVELGISVGALQRVLSEAKRKLCFIACIEIALTALFSWIFGSFLMRQLSELQGGVKQVRAGNLSHRVKVHGEDELAQMASAFNDMCEDLEETTRLRDQEQEELCRYRDHLEQVVEERAKELAKSSVRLRGETEERHKVEAERQSLEEQLRQIQKMDSLGTLAGGIAHDFNNILQGIIAANQVVQRQMGEHPQVAEHTERVQKFVERGADLVREILTFSRQEEQELTPLSMSKLTAEAIELLRASLPATIEITADIDRDDDVVSGNATQLRQVIVNLCTNAHYAMRDTGGVISVTLKHCAAPQTKSLQSCEGIELCVSDNGPGIPEEYWERVFEPFFTTKPVGEGSGMGLAIVHGIVKHHSGSIALESMSGAGTTVRIWLPVVGESVTEDPMVMVPESGGERILMVDDEEEVLAIQREILLSEGYQVTAMSSSADAVEFFSENANDFDLVITDQTMPKLTGIQLSRKILAIRPEIPIILMTGYGISTIQEDLKRHNIKRCVMKPFSVEEMGRAIQGVMAEPPDGDKAPG